MSIGSSRPSKVSVLATEIMSTLLRSVTVALEQWTNDSKNNFPSPGAWVCLPSLLYKDMNIQCQNEHERIQDKQFLYGFFLINDMSF